MQNTLQILAHQGHRLSGGADRARTDDLLHAMQALFQLSYGPTQKKIKHIRSGLCVQSKSEMHRDFRSRESEAMISAWAWVAG